MATSPRDPLAGKSREKLHVQLAQLFRNKIVSQVWPLGDAIPTLEALMQQHAVSRTTVRMALATLIEEGLLTTRKRGGTQVVRKPFQPPSFLLPATWSELVAFGAQIAPQTLASESGCMPLIPPGISVKGALAPEYQRLLRVHTHENAKFCFSELYLEQNTYSALAAKLPTSTLADALGNDPSVIACARQHLSVAPADERIADALNVSLGTPLMQALRWASNPDGLILYWAKVSFLSEYVHIEMDLLK